MQVDFDDYLAALAKERKHGAQRARQQGNRMPVLPRTDRSGRFRRAGVTA
jgi:hypothetical protein